MIVNENKAEKAISQRGDGNVGGWVLGIK